MISERQHPRPQDDSALVAWPLGDHLIACGRRKGGLMVAAAAAGGPCPPQRPQLHLGVALALSKFRRPRERALHTLEVAEGIRVPDRVAKSGLKTHFQFVIRPCQCLNTRERSLDVLAIFAHQGKLEPK